MVDLTYVINEGEEPTPVQYGRVKVSFDLEIYHLTDPSGLAGGPLSKGQLVWLINDAIEHRLGWLTDADPGDLLIAEASNIKLSGALGGLTPPITSERLLEWVEGTAAETFS